MHKEQSLPDSATPAGSKKISWREILPTFLALAFALAVSLGLLIFLHVKESISHNIELITRQQHNHLELAQIILEQELEKMSTDLLAFANVPVIKGFFSTPNDQSSRQKLNQGLSNYIQYREDYEQAQVLDARGRELVRVEKRDGSVVAIPIEELQTIEVDTSFHGRVDAEARGRIFFSPMELARDQNGRPRQPLHPLLHLATPIFDQHNHQVGSLLFTYRGQSLFELFTRTIGLRHDLDEKQRDNSQIINQEGYWLLAPDKDDEWGSARDPQRRFDRRFSKIWKGMHEQDQGQFQTAYGLFTFRTLPLALTREISRAEGSSTPAALSKEVDPEATHFWFLLTQVPHDEVDRLNFQIWRMHIILFLVILAGSLPLLLWVALLMIKERQHKKYLQIQEQRFRLLYEMAPLPYLSLDPKGHLLNINQAWLAALGYSRDEVLGRWFGDFVKPESLTQFQDFFYLVTEKNQKKYCELELIKNDGSLFLASFHSDHIADDQGASRQIHCILNDITALKAEKKRTIHLSILLHSIIEIHRIIGEEKEKQQLVQRCCESLVTNRGYTSAWIILLNSDGKIESSAEAGLLHDIDQLKHQIDLGNTPLCIQECSTHQGIVSIDTPAIFCSACPMANGYPKTGIMCAAIGHNSTVYGYLNVSLPPDFIQNQKEKDRFSEIAMDLGYALFNLQQQENKLQTERSLRQSEERLRGITDSAQDPILMMDFQGAISYWNPAAEKIMGYRAEEALGKNLHALLAPQRYHEAQQAAFPEFFRSGHGNAIGKTIELSALHKDGREIPVTLSLSAVLLDEKWQAVGILRDITDRKLMEERMLQTEKMAIIAGLAAGVAHEINTPLSAILQSIQVIRQCLSPDLARNLEIAGQYDLDLAKVQDYFQKREINFFMDGIKDSAIKSAKIINNLLQFSRPQTGTFFRENLTLLLDKSVELAKNDYDLKKRYDILNVEIVREYTPGLPSVSCVASEIEQVFINLLKNAVQAMADRAEPRPKGRIILRTLHHEGKVRVEIEDNGPGMDEETKRHIFDPFFTTKEIGVGTGLGLSVSYTLIVTKHGGELTVRSTPGHGTTMTIDLPVNQEKIDVDL